MKITIYTIKDCAFSKQEKEYLNTNNLPFEEKDLETNKDFLTEMLAISNNFAGTPVTRVEKDDGTIAVLKGFTKEEFDTTLGLVPAVAPAPVAEVPPVAPIETVSPAPIPTPPAETPDLSAEASAKVDPLKSVMDDLQTKAGQPLNPDPIAPPVEATPVVPVPPTPLNDAPVATPPVDPAAPAIPDFPGK